MVVNGENLLKAIFVFIIVGVAWQTTNSFQFTKNASCRSDEYCPAGWSVKRRVKDYSAMTCNPTTRNKEEKCPKPYMCVASRCGINFCCSNDRMLDKYKEKEMEEHEAEENKREEAEEEAMAQQRSFASVESNDVASMNNGFEENSHFEL